MAINTTGKPNTLDYFLGRGIVYLAELDASQLPKGYRDLGNSPGFSISVESEELLHQASRTGLKVTDKRITLSQDIKISFQVDELSHDNQALFFTGTTESVTNPGVAGIGGVGSQITISAAVELGKWYDLKTAYDGSGVASAFSDNTKIHVREKSGPTNLVEGTDYEVDLEMGRIFLLSTASNIAAGEGMEFYTAADAGAPATLQLMHALAGSAGTSYALKFIAENPANASEKIEYEFHSVSISADGDLALIGDDFAVASFSGAAQKNSNVNIDATLTVRASVRS